MRSTRVVATLGPASDDVGTLTRMIEAGLDVARVSYSHGDHASHERLVAAVREASEAVGRRVAVLQDLQGLKLRLGKDVAERTLEEGDRVPLEDLHLPEAILDHLEPGTRLVLGDGAPVLRETDGALVVQVPGKTRPRMGVNAPDLPIPGGLTEKDQDDLLHGREIGVDWVALSFVGAAADVMDAKELLAAKGEDIPLMAKVERTAALQNLEEILAVADGVMVARGDLGIALPLQRIPLAQKRILQTAAAMGKVSITATQMAESMLHSPVPTRAEVTDIANAVLDGTHGVMLSGESAMGDYPVEAVQLLADVTRTTEEAVRSKEVRRPPAVEAEHHDPVTHAAFVLATEIEARAVAAYTRSAASAIRVAAHRPDMPVLAATPHEGVAQLLKAVAHIIPHQVEEAHTLDDVHRVALEAAKATDLAEHGDEIVVVSGDLGVSGTTSTVRVLQVR